MASEVRPDRRIEINKNDLDAWSFLLRDAQRKSIDASRAFYEKLVGQFPNAGRFWRAYIEHELKARNFENVEKLFQRCLMKVLSIDLWKCYLNYVRDAKGHLPSFREKMAQAYDFALDKIGFDLLSGSVYIDYIAFLKSVPASGSYAENQRITAVRKVYQRAIVTPLLNVDQIWNDYYAYEKNVNPQLAEKLIADKVREYHTARRVSKAMETVMKGINRQQVAVPPAGTPGERKQVELWRKYIQWEKTNPLQTEDYALFAKRVVFGFEQALLCLGYYPDIWYEAAVFMQEASRTLSEKGDVKKSGEISDDISSWYERATTTLLKGNTLLYFAYADYEEERMKFEKVQQIYNRFIELPEIDPTLAYIQYMRFARRTEGIKAARAVFKRAREDGRTKCQIYCAAALMEYYCAKDTNVALRIMELGQKKFGDQASFALAYVEFLSHMNEDNNTRVLFERLLTAGSLAAENSIDVWDKYIEFENNVGDLATITKVDKRRRQALEKEGEGIQTTLLIDRYKFMDLFPCTSEQLRALGYSKVEKAGSSNVAAASSAGTTERIPAIAAATAESFYPKPDLAMMLPFKPKIVTTSSYHPIPGGVFPPPAAAAHLLSMIPPPWCFQGPFVSVDMLMEKFGSAVLPDEEALLRPDAAVENGAGAAVVVDPKLDEIRKDFLNLLATTPDPLQALATAAAGVYAQDGKKRPFSRDEEATPTPAPAHDIYRMRQQYKRVART